MPQPKPAETGKRSEKGNRFKPCVVYSKGVERKIELIPGVIDIWHDVHLRLQLAHATDKTQDKSPP